MYFFINLEKQKQTVDNIKFSYHDLSTYESASELPYEED